MSKQKYVSPDRTLKYHVSMWVFPPVPIRIKNTVRDVIRLAKAGRNDATVQWYGKKTPVSQVAEECNLSDFVRRGGWVATMKGSQLADFVLPKEDGSILDGDPTLLERAGVP